MKPITELWAWVSDADGPREAPIGLVTPMGALPMVHTKREVMEEFRYYAQAHADATGRPARLVHLKDVEVIETLEPKGKGSAS